MDRNECRFDRFGNEFGKEYTTILTDPAFEMKLKQFDPNLRLFFNKEVKRWVILEWALDCSGWNVIFIFEDDYKHPMPVGDWVFMHLREMRNTNERLRKNPKQFFLDTYNLSDRQFDQEDRRIDDETRHLLREHRNEFRKGWRALNKMPLADVTAGYRKI